MKPAQILIGVIIAALAVTAGFWAAQAILKDQAPRHDLSATRFPVARDIQPFELIDHHSAAFDQAALQQHWSITKAISSSSNLSKGT